MHYARKIISFNFLLLFAFIYDIILNVKANDHKKRFYMFIKNLIEKGIDTESPDCENKTIEDLADKCKRDWLKGLLKK